MAKEIYRYTIHRVGVKKALVRGEVRVKDLTAAIKKLQRKIRKDVVKRKIEVTLKIWQADEPRNRFERRYASRRDFKKMRLSRPKWRRELSRKAKYSRTFDPSPSMWFVAVGKRRQLSLTKLAYEPKIKTLLRRKRKKLFGPFDTEEQARQFLEQLERGVESHRKQTEFSKPEGAQ